MQLRALHSPSRATRENKSRRRSHNIRINQTSDHSRFNIVHHTRNWTIFLLGFMLYVCSNHRDCVTLPHSEMNSRVEWTEGQTLSNLKPKPDPRADVEVFLLWSQRQFTSQADTILWLIRCLLLDCWVSTCNMFNVQLSESQSTISKYILLENHWTWLQVVPQKL